MEIHLVKFNSFEMNDYNSLISTHSLSSHLLFSALLFLFIINKNLMIRFGSSSKFTPHWK